MTSPFPENLPSDARNLVRPWNIRQSAVGLCCSLVVHVIVLLGMASIVFNVASRDDIPGVTGVLGEPESPTPDLVLESPMELVSGGEDAPSEAEKLAEQLSESQTRRALATTLTGIGEGEGLGEGDGSGAAVTVPPVNVPGHAVTKGSFSVWTEPKDPDPAEDYFIRVLVRLPDTWKGTRYRLRDITGMVIGTDGFKYPIRFRNETAEVKDGAVQFQIFIPGAYKKVRDTIRIQSKLLKEKQLIELEF